MTGFLFQLGGPMQSWGEHSEFGDRDTTAHPTRSGLIGLIASALGITRDRAHPGAGPGAAGVRFDDLARLRFTIRVDRPGVRLRDYHTVGGGLPRHRTVPTASGTRRSAEAATVVTHRHYLADAVFTVAVTTQDADHEELLTACDAALRRPHWPPHMGRRSCPPGAVLLLRTAVDDPYTELFDRVPLARPASHTPPTVQYTSDTPFPPGAADAVVPPGAVTVLNDDPVRLTARDRRYRQRPAYTVVRPFTGPCGGYGTDYLSALDTYLNGLRDGGTS
ncbi:type I-E CRISPR-associated protein Cas5/CasD [Streptomyces murinus]|uniref:type I-E CRISPR-associated protein Cas5/CasD n=1 Tax=Streptomyces murinus TaxID=33900 RepID=UPI002E0F9E31|nr:type I-E CRISPR-associated protein Cas5/CasD [Streptomyces murinus]WSI87333.1 type I-E CRISPR-associated protein Cas5/CasD [Streptomyces murinus]